MGAVQIFFLRLPSNHGKLTICFCSGAARSRNLKQGSEFLGLRGNAGRPVFPCSGSVEFCRGRDRTGRLPFAFTLYLRPTRSIGRRSDDGRIGRSGYCGILRRRNRIVDGDLSRAFGFGWLARHRSSFRLPNAHVANGSPGRRLFAATADEAPVFIDSIGKGRVEAPALHRYRILKLPPIKLREPQMRSAGRAIGCPGCTVEFDLFAATVKTRLFGLSHAALLYNNRAT